MAATRSDRGATGRGAIDGTTNADDGPHCGPLPACRNIARCDLDHRPGSEPIKYCRCIPGNRGPMIPSAAATKESSCSTATKPQQGKDRSGIAPKMIGGIGAVLTLAAVAAVVMSSGPQPSPAPEAQAAPIYSTETPAPSLAKLATIAAPITRRRLLPLRIHLLRQPTRSLPRRRRRKSAACRNANSMFRAMASFACTTEFTFRLRSPRRISAGSHFPAFPSGSRRVGGRDRSSSRAMRAQS